MPVLAGDFVTLAEKGQWKVTGPAAEAVSLCRLYQKKFPKIAQCNTYGKTPEGRDLVYLHLGDRKDPVVWVQAGIHAGEIDGKDAVYWLLREIFVEKSVANPLKGISLVFIPMVSPDGHERTGKWNRPNQVGPEEMGWRTTAQNYNLNRDFMKTDAPEMIALINLWNKMNPVLSLDLHVTDGAQFQPEVGLIVLPTEHSGSTDLHKAGSQFENELLVKMKERGRMALPFYPSFEEDDQPYSGFARYVALPRFAHGYWSSNQRLAMLIETHSWKDYANRVRTHHDTVLSSLEIASLHARDWKKTEDDVMGLDLSGKTVPLEYKHTNKSSKIQFPGYKFEISKSKISGADVIHYFPDQKTNWEVPYYEELAPALSVEAPQKGYYVGRVEAEWLKTKLLQQGIRFEELKAKPSEALVFRAHSRTFTPDSFEGHQMLKVEGSWKEEKVSFLPGSIFIPIKQPKALLLMKLLEPLSQDSYLSWGFFNRYFERKEYMENYVAEDVGREMLKDPVIKAEFEKRLETDEAFKKSPDQRFEFFYRKHASWDNRMNMYPVYKR